MHERAPAERFPFGAPGLMQAVDRGVQCMNGVRTTDRSEEAA